jgi:uncharacterized protein (DUF1015 family)
MAHLVPFRPYRYSAAAGPLDDLVTQPYDKISGAMQAAYLARSPYNIVRVILGERFAADTESRNVYTRAAAHLREWIAAGVLERDLEPAFYPYFQEFTVPDTGERLTRKGFVALGPVEEYSAGVVYRHEQTLSGPKKDRLDLTRHTRACLEQLFLLYSDPEGGVDRILDEAAEGAPLARVCDEYGAVHSLWRIAERERIAGIQRLMSGRKLLIADGHHRYETALAFRRENPGLAAARHVMMTLVNMDSPGLRILATHRLLRDLPSFDPEELSARLRALFRVEELASEEALRARWAAPAPGRVRLAFAAGPGPGMLHLEAPRPEGALDVSVLHETILAGLIGISEEAVRDERHLGYVRGIEAAVGEVRRGSAQAAFLMEPATIEQVARVSFAGGVMPQKSTDFYPKLLSGLTLYRMDE